MKSFRMTFLSVAMIIAFTAPAAAQTDWSVMRADLVASLQDAHQKISGLAESMPEEKYAWRPAEDVRSVREALLHVAAANYFFGNMVGTPVPEGINPRELEQTVTGRDATLDQVNHSFEHIISAVEEMDENQAGMMVDWFGDQQRPVHAILMSLSSHAHEHLGQLIAYARMNGVVPPWSG